MKPDYGRIADYYDRVRTNDADYLRFWTAPLVKFGRIGRDSRVLDVGCGTGRFTITMEEMTGASVYGLDASADMLKRAKKKSDGVKWVQGSAEDLPFENGFFDTVTVTMAIHQFEKKREAIAEAARVLKSGGHLVVLTTSHGRIRGSYFALFPGIAAIDLKRFPTIPQIKKWMKEEGMTAEYHIVRRKREIPVDTVIDWMKKRFISTLELMDDREFERGLAVFEKRMKEKYGGVYRDMETFYYVTGKKSSLQFFA